MVTGTYYESREVYTRISNYSVNFQVQEQEVSSQSNAATGALNLTLQQEKLALESRMLNLESLVREKDEVGPLLCTGNHLLCVSIVDTVLRAD